MFAYCSNDPSSKLDNNGKDAIWIFEESSASGMGHVGLMVQDELGIWHYFFWGPEDNIDAVLNIKQGTKSRCILAPILVDSNTLRTKQGVIDAVDASPDPSVSERSTLISSTVYLEGDYTKTYDFLNFVDQYSSSIDYNLIVRNCLQVSATALAASNSAFKEYADFIIPKLAQGYLMTNNSDYKRIDRAAKTTLIAGAIVSLLLT